MSTEQKKMDTNAFEVHLYFKINKIKWKRDITELNKQSILL